MRQFFSTILSQIYSQRGAVLCGLAIALCISLVSLSVAHAAGFWDGILGVIDSGVGTILSVIAVIVELMFKAVAGVMMLVIHYFMSLTVVPNPQLDPQLNTPAFVTEGWNFSRNLVNIIFILILTFIGLATILRLQSYQLQKTLPGLIIIALLVNFSGLLVGFFVDVGNISTKVFLDEIQGGWEFSGLNWGVSSGAQLAKIIFFALATLIYFVVMLLFAVRIMILWVLTIMAPIAFGAYILPATKKYWTQWFGQVIQWSIIGTPISFFMYFAKLALSAPAPGNPGGLGILSGFIANYTELLLLFAGITLSMKLAPAGAQGAINFAKKLPRRITESRMGARAAAWGASKTQGTLSGLAPALKNLEGKGLLGKVTGMALRPSGWAAQGINRLAGGKLLEYAASKRRTTLPKNFDQMSEEELETWTQANNVSGGDLVQFAARMQDKKKYKHTTQAFKDKVNAATEQASNQRWLSPEVGTLKDVVPETVTKDLLINLSVLEVTPEEREGARKKAQANIDKVVKEIQDEARANPELQTEIDKWTALDARTGVRKTIEDLAAAKIYAQELKPQDIPNVIRPKTLPFRLAIKDSNPASLQRLQDNFDHETLEDMFKGVGGLNAASNTPGGLETLAKRNPRLVRALFTNPVLQGMAWEGRNQMRDFNDRITTNFEVFERKMRVKELIEQRPTQKPMLEQGAKLIQDITEVQNKLAEARQAQIPQAEINDIQTQMQDVKDRFAVFKETVIEKDTDLKVVWDQIETLIVGQQRRGGRGPRQGGGQPPGRRGPRQGGPQGGPPQGGPAGNEPRPRTPGEATLFRAIDQLAEGEQQTRRRRRRR